MSTYAVVLIIDTDATDTPPDAWDWSDVLDTPHAVTCMEAVEIDADPSPATCADVANRVRELADSLRRVAPVRD